ncbi:putative peptide permease protein BMEII0861 [Anaerolineaceae bacterium]|nr:putative peptide permease protein BMEII0861 [Anaerolineaceae bacterium]
MKDGSPSGMFTNFDWELGLHPAMAFRFLGTLHPHDQVVLTKNAGTALSLYSNAVAVSCSLRPAATAVKRHSAGVRRSPPAGQRSHTARVPRGSSASRRPSPTKFTLSTVIKTNKPGNTHNHGALSK